MDVYIQVNGPSVYKNFLAAAHHLGLSEGASGYWALHIKEDERHGRQMVDDVAVPLVDMCAPSASAVGEHAKAIPMLQGGSHAHILQRVPQMLNVSPLHMLAGILRTRGKSCWDMIRRSSWASELERLSCNRSSRLNKESNDIV